MPVVLLHMLDADKKNCMYCGKPSESIKAEDEPCRGSVKLRALAELAVDKLRDAGWVSLSDEVQQELA